MTKPKRSSPITLGDVLRNAAHALTAKSTATESAPAPASDEIVPSAGAHPTQTTPPPQAASQEPSSEEAHPAHQPPAAEPAAPSDAGEVHGHPDQGAGRAPHAGAEPQLARPQPPRREQPMNAEPLYIVRKSDGTLFPTDCRAYLLGGQDRLNYRYSLPDEDEALRTGGVEAMQARIAENNARDAANDWLRTPIQSTGTLPERPPASPSETATLVVGR